MMRSLYRLRFLHTFYVGSRQSFDQFHEAGVVKITNGGLTSWLYPFGMLESHVDGSNSAQVFIYSGVQLKKLSEEHGAQRERKIYLLCNARLDPEWGEVERRTLSINFKAIDSLIEYHVIGDLYRIYAITERDGADFNLAYIPETFKVPHKKQFDTAYMRQLYEFGFAKAAAGYRWAKQPPPLVGEDQGDSP